MFLLGLLGPQQGLLGPQQALSGPQQALLGPQQPQKEHLGGRTGIEHVGDGTP